jgi:hypothetical protein
MMTKDEALKMAIEYIEKSQYEKHDEVINACKEALEQPQPRLFLDLSNSHGNHPVEQPAQRNFCERCGKRASKDSNHIHTCTPPQALKEKNHVS